MKFFKEHWLALVISILIGIVIAAPPFTFRFSRDFSGVDMLKTNTETHYVAQIQEVYDGHPELGNPFMGGELKKALYLFPPLGPNLMANIGRLLGLEAIEMVMVSRFFLTALLALAIYYFSFLLTGRRLIGLVAAPAVTLGYALVDPNHILELLNLKSWSQEMQFIDYGRPINPQLSSLFFFGYLVFFWQFIYKGKSWVYGIASSLLLGLSFYVYLYTWSFIFVLNGILLLVYLIKKDWSKVKKIVYVSVGALMIGIPYFIHNYKVTLHPLYEESSARFGFFQTRLLELSRLVIISAVLFAVSRKLFSKGTREFFLAFFFAAVAVVNEQLITGFYVFNHHWHWYYNTPLVIIFLVSFLFMFLEKFSVRARLSSVLASILIISFFYNGIITQRISYNFHLPTVVAEQQYSSLFEWINDRASKDDVFLTSIGLSAMIPAYTHGNVYYHGTGIYTLTSSDQLLHSYLVYAYLDGVGLDQIKDYLEENREDISNFAFGYTYRFKKGVCPGCFPEEIIEKMVREYQGLNDNNFTNFIKQYRADYLIWDGLNKSGWQPERFGWSKIIEGKGYAVYGLNSSP